MKELLFVTGNQNKIKDASLYLIWYSVKTAWVDVPEIQDVNVSNVIKEKLKSAYNETKIPCFVMDASLIINWLCKDWIEKKFPWALIKDVFGNMWDVNITKLVSLSWDNKCLWKSVLWYYDWKNEYYFEESVEWKISNTPRWNNWHDWDTIFMPIWENRTFAEMTFDEKHSYALTKKLYKQFADFLNE
jgi:XTP/dITP diphosphohydrolase